MENQVTNMVTQVNATLAKALKQKPMSKEKQSKLHKLAQ